MSDNNSFASYEENLIGPSYDYASYISPPSELGVKSKGSISQIKTNYVAMGEYFKLILSGKSRASKEGSQFSNDGNIKGDGRVLGPSFFIDTFAKCNPVEKVNGNFVTNKKKKVQRSIYYNFKPTGDILIANAGGDLRGMFPGILSNLDMITPGKMINSVFQGGTPPCYQVRMPVFPSEGNNYAKTQVRYVSKDDLNNVNECAFVIDNEKSGATKNYPNLLNIKANIHPLTNQKCRSVYAKEKNVVTVKSGEALPTKEKFSNYSTIPNDNLVEIYIGALSVLLLLLLLKIYKHNN